MCGLNGLRQICLEPYIWSRAYIPVAPDICSWLPEGRHLQETSLHGATILIGGDEPLIALDLLFAIEDAGGIVIGSAATSVEALAMIAVAEGAMVAISAAVLHCNLSDRDSAPVIVRLHASGVPMVVYSAVGLPPECRTLSAEIPWIAKPESTKLVVAMLDQKIQAAPATKTIRNR